MVERERTAASSGREVSAQISEALDATQQARRRRSPQPPVVQQRRPVRAGDRVRIHSLQQNGEVLSVDGNDAMVQMGALRSRVAVGDLERTSGLGDDGVGESNRASQPLAQATPDVSTETDIRGLRAADVEPRLEQYLQDAYLTGLPWVRIIHGKGTGALRKVVRDVLQSNPVVERSETARQNEGGDGATVAWLRSG